MRYLREIHNTYWTKGWLKKYKNGKDEMTLVRKRVFWLSIQMLGSDQTTAMQIDTLDYSKNFGVVIRPVVLPKQFIKTGMENRTESFIFWRQKRWTNQTMLSYLYDSKCQKQLNLNTDLKKVKCYYCFKCGTNENRSRAMISHAFQLSVASFQMDDLG